MHLYMSESPIRTLYLVTSSQEEVQGRPSRALVFRAANDRPSQAIVEFLPKSEVDLSNATKLSNRIIKGCLGLISITGGESFHGSLSSLLLTNVIQRYSWQLSPQPRKSATRDLQQRDPRRLLKSTK